MAEEGKPKQRTLRQNRMAHLWFTHLAEALNESGNDMQVVLSKRMEVWWTPESVKECLFKALTKAMYNKDSTTQLTTKEFTKVADMLRDVLARDYGVNVDIPSIECVINQQRISESSHKEHG